MFNYTEKLNRLWFFFWWFGGKLWAETEPFPPRIEMSNTRGHSYLVRREKFNANVQGRFWLRLVGAWNTLPGVVVEVDRIVAFKRLLDRQIEAYGSCTGRWDLASCSAKHCGWRAHSHAVLFYVLIHVVTGTVRLLSNKWWFCCHVCIT